MKSLKAHLREQMAGFVENPEPAPDDTEIFWVLPENAQACEVFLACASQWKLYPATGKRMALDYVALEAVMRMLQVAEPPELFAKIRAMESAALKEIYGNG